MLILTPVAIYLYGSGGHAKVILDILRKQNRPVDGIADDFASAENTNLYGVPIYSADTILKQPRFDDIYWIIAVGNNQIRQLITNTLRTQGCHFTTAIHPSAQIALGVSIAPGTVIMANAVVNSDVEIGHHVIINTGATVDHDCQIQDYAHIAPGSSLCGNVLVGTGALLGVGTKIKPGLTVGAWTTCGAGAIVVKSLPSHAVAYGCPAQVMSKVDSQSPDRIKVS